MKRVGCTYRQRGRSHCSSRNTQREVGLLQTHNAQTHQLSPDPPKIAERPYTLVTVLTFRRAQPLPFMDHEAVRRHCMHHRKLDAWECP